MPVDPTHNRRLAQWQACLMLLWLALLALVALRSITPPSPRSTNAPAEAFSASRALMSLREIAKSPHPQGASEHARVRDYLLAQLRQLGVSPQLQTTPVVGARTSRPYRAATVHNIWARIPGTNPTGTVLLAAHYDSVSTGPGASDDGASAAALLETLRALQSRSDITNPANSQSPSPGGEEAAREGVHKWTSGVRYPFRLRNDLVILLTDGEETGLLGARAFVEGGQGTGNREQGTAGNAERGMMNDEWNSHSSLITHHSSFPTLVLNFEARGTSGPSLMFETSAGNGWLARQFGQGAIQPLGSSLFYAVYKKLPNDTDFTEFRDGGMIGLNFAFIDRAAHYHTSLDSVERLDLRSLQHQGDNMLSLARQFGNVSLTEARQPDAIYFNITRTWLCAYPETWAVPLAMLATLLTVVVLRLFWRGNGRRYGQTGIALLSGLLRVGGAVVAVVLMLAGLTYWLTSGAVTPRMTLYLDNTTLAGVILLTMGSVILLLDWKRSARKHDTTAGNGTNAEETAETQTRPRKREKEKLQDKEKSEADVSKTEGEAQGAPGLQMPFLLARDAVAMGAMVWWLLLAWLTALLLPGGSYLFVWPLLGVLVAQGLLFAPRKWQEGMNPAQIALTCLMLGLAPAVLLVLPVLCLLFATLSIGSLTIVGALTALTIALLYPQMRVMVRVAPLHPQALPLLLMAIGAVLLWVGAEALQPSETRPRSNSIFYALNADTHTAVWASNDRKPDDWTKQFLGEHPLRGALPDVLPVSPETFLHTPAPLAPLAAPTAVLESERVENGVRELRLRVASPRHAPLLEIAADANTPVLDATIEGKPIGGSIGLNHAWSLLYFNAPDAGLTLTLRVKSTAPLTLRVIDRSYGLPALPDKTFAPRPVKHDRVARVRLVSGHHNGCENLPVLVRLLCA